MTNKHEIKQLLEKHLNRELSRAETNELFDRLRTIHNPVELEVYFRSTWDLDRTSTIHSNLTWKQILEESNRQSVSQQAKLNRTKIRLIWKWGVAASVLLLLSLVCWKWDSGSEYITYNTGFGETKNIVLDDGTSVILNANSVLNWKSAWREDNIRYVQLQGEAFFDVAHVDQNKEAIDNGSDLGARMSFRVNTADVLIDVLGTAFNVAERRGVTQVYLEEGSVQLGLLEMDVFHDRTMSNTDQNPVDGNLKPVKMVLMQPGESIGYSAETKELQNNDPKQSKALTEWKDGSLLYDNVSFGEMLDHMEDIYGKEFEIEEDELRKKRISAALPYENWEIVKKLIEVAFSVEFIPGTDNKIRIKERKE